MNKYSWIGYLIILPGCFSWWLGPDKRWEGNKGCQYLWQPRLEGAGGWSTSQGSSSVQFEVSEKDNWTKDVVSWGWLVQETSYFKYLALRIKGREVVKILSIVISWHSRLVQGGCTGCQHLKILPENSVLHCSTVSFTIWATRGTLFSF